MSKRFYIRPDFFANTRLDAAKELHRQLGHVIEWAEQGNAQGNYYLGELFGEDAATEEWLNQKISDDERTLRHSFNPDFV